MVLGAGLGSRLKPFTERFPKPLIPVLGVPCIDYSILSLQDAGVTEIVVNVHAKADQMIEHLKGPFKTAKNTQKNILKNTQISDETSLLLGSAGGFRKALSLLGKEPFFAMNADVLSCVHLDELARRHHELVEKHDVWMTLVLARGEALKAQTGSYREIFVNEAEGLVTGFGEKKVGIPFYTGTGVFDPRCFEHLEEGKPAEFVPEVLEPLIQRKKVGFLYSENLWMDIGSAELWWKSHFDLWNAYKGGLLPESWNQAIEKGMKKVYLSEKDGVVDYSLPEKIIGKNYIQLETIHYAIPSLGN